MHMHLFLNRATSFTTLLFFSVHFPLDLLSTVFIISARRAPRSGLSSCWAILNKYYQSINQYLVSGSSNLLSVTDFVPKGIISGVRVQAGLYLDMLDADRSPNAVSVHAGISQVDFEVDCSPPARSTRRSFDHHGKGNGNFV